MTPTAAAASGKKRPASSSDHDDDDDSDDDGMDNNSSFFSRIVSSVTPWKRKNKRARSSLDSMSGSAIKSASRLPTSEDSDRSGHGSNGGAGGGSSGKATLEKLNLEHKFHEAPAPAAAVTRPVQTLKHDGQQQTANNTNGGNAAKRVRITESAAGTVAPPPPTTATTNGTTNGGEGGAVKAVRIGGTTFVSSSSNNNTASSATARSSSTVTFQDATMPRFNIGSTTKLKDVRGRNATPGRGGRSKWGTPSSKAAAASRARFGSKNNTLPQDGLLTNGIATTSSNKGGFQRRSIGSLSTASRGGGAYRRRAINARKFKPMGNLLSRIHTDHATGRNGGAGAGAAAGQSKQQSLFLSNSIADQILRDTQNKLFQSTASGVGGNYQETALFGVAPSDNNNYNGARTFQEEEAQYKAVTKKGSAVPRVRMNRVFGSGQIGGRVAQLESAPSAATTTAMSFGAGAAPAASISLQPSIADKSIVPKATSFAAPPAPSRNAADLETKDKAVVGPSETTTSAPFKTNPIPARDAGITKFLPCDADENLSQQLGNEISQLASTEAFKRKAVQNNPFGDVGEATKTPKKKKSKGTPHPKKAGGSNTKPVTEAAGGTPFNFMPGGGAASSKVDTPLAFDYSKKSEVPQSSSPAVTKTPSKKVAPVAADTNASETTTATTSQGWGNLFASQKKQWKCNVCTSQNPLDETACLSCEAPRDGTASKSSPTPGGDKNGSDKKANAGTGGLKFGAPSSTATASAGSIGAGGFSFGIASSSTASTSTPAIKFGVTPSKAKEQVEKDDSKISASSGFSFGSATPSKTKPSSGGFNFGGNTSAAPPSKTDSNVGGSDGKKGEASKGSAGFSFGAPSASSSSTPSSKTNATFGFSLNSASSGGDENKGDTANTGAFKFGASTSDPKPKRGRGEDEENGKQGGGKKKASVGAGFSFGSNATESKSTPTTSFGFGTATKKEDAPAAPAATFAFGSTPSGKKTDNAASSFAFGSAATDVKKKSDTAPAGASGFSFGQSSASSGAPSINAEKKEPSFKFGQATSATEKKDNSVATPAPAFAFGAAAPTAAAKEPAPTAAFQFGSQAPAAAPPVAAAPPPAASLFGGSGFGMTQSAAPQPAAPVQAPAPAFGFGAASQTPAPAPAFGFGASAQPAAPATNPGFAFGSNPTAAPAPPPAFGMPPAAPPVAAHVQAFGLQSAPTPAPTPGFGGGGFGGTQAPPAMNSGAASGGFNIGTGGGAKKTPGRRIVRARRPPGSGR